MTKYLFPDTNVFLQCKIFTEIRWRDLFKNVDKQDNIIIVIADKVNNELDNLKKNQKKSSKYTKKNTRF